MNEHNGQLNDLELDQLLSAASTPPDIVGLEGRLLLRMAATNATTESRDNVVPFLKPIVKVQHARAATRGFGIAAVLAASLMLGVLIGNGADVSAVVESVTGFGAAGQIAEFAPTGFDDLGKLDGEIDS